MDKSDKEIVLNLAVSQIERLYGRGSIMRLGADVGLTDVGVISTGSLGLDTALGIGGIPRGRMTEIYGPEASGKTTIALHIVAEAQRAGGVAACIDAEHALDPTYAHHLGIDLENLLISQPDTGEQALGIVEVLVRSGALDVIVVDSVAALVPKAELDGDMGEAPMGAQARLMAQGLRKLTAIVSKSRTSIIFINQLRQKIGVVFGNPDTTTGGNALKYSASVRLDVRRLNALKRGEEIIGNRTRVRVVKNKLAPPFRQAEFDILYGQGISRPGELLDLAVEHGLITKRGTWFTYQDTRMGQGRDQAKSFLLTSVDIAVALEAHVRQQLGLATHIHLS
jgi:recombination protein RecA